MQRRHFIKLGMQGLTVIAVGSSAGIPQIFRASEAYAANQTINLTLEAALVEMVDLTQVFMWVFSSPALGPSFPGPVIFASPGDRLTVNITNNLNEPHAFQIVGTNINSGPISPGQTKTLRFRAPKAGTYLYIDPLNAPVNRVLGLHGAFIVLPPSLSSRNNTPYSSPTFNVNNLFNQLGNSVQFPGEPWIPPRSRIWLFSSIDPAFNALAEAGATINPVVFVQNFLPRYFTINGKSGAFASHDPAIIPAGLIGQPHLIRILNAGLANHSAHQHANHVYVTSVNNVVQKNVFLVDTFTIKPLDRVDWLLPFIRPDDIPGNPATPLRNLIPNELALVLGDVPQSPLSWPMHCHMEMSQTAAGGNYPQGMVTHMEITGDLDGVLFPHS